MSFSNSCDVRVLENFRKDNEVPSIFPKLVHRDEDQETNSCGSKSFS